MNDIIILAQQDDIASGVIENFINNNGSVRAAVQAFGVLMLLMVLGKFVWDKRKGQGGGQQNQLGQVLVGLLAAAAIFVPAFLGSIVDTGIRAAVAILDVASNVFTGTDTGEENPGTTVIDQQQTDQGNSGSTTPGS